MTGLRSGLPYSSGPWTPTDNSGATLVFTSVNCYYTQIGNLVFIYGTLTYPSTVSGSNASLGGLPFTVGSTSNPGVMTLSGSGLTSDRYLQPVGGSLTASIVSSIGTPSTNTGLSTKQIAFSGFYSLV